MRHCYTPSQFVLLLSDVHLTSDDDPLFKRLQDSLHAHDHFPSAIYILGDLFDFWAGNRCQDRYLQVLNFLHTISKKCPVFFMPGNRDFLASSSLLQKYNIQKIPDPTLLRHGEKTILLTHGDRLCAQDKGYLLLRAFLQNPLSKLLIHSLPYDWCLKASKRLRQKSSTITKTKKREHMQACTHTTIRWLNYYRADAIIYGHVHHLEQKQIMNKPPKYAYILDSWENQYNYCVIHRHNIELIIAPST